MKTKKKVNTLVRAFETKNATTANGAVTHSTSSNAVLDFFGMGAAARQQTDAFVTNLFDSAMAEDKSLALKVLFYIRDVRGGQGERKVFRTCFKWLANNDAPVAKKLIKHVAEYGRFDDLFCLEGTPLEKDMFAFLKKNLAADIKNTTDQVSLLAKWLPSEQASSKETKRLAKKFREYMKMSPKAYRKTLSELRKKINIVERLMCSGDWNEINFQSVPSRAAMIYKDAFKKHDEVRYASYLSLVEKGEAKINASTLYPYDLCLKAIYSDDKTIELQWKALPDYLAENPHNGLVVCDVSGSMCAGGPPRPLDVSISLALYFAERNKGAFENYFLTFSESSKLVKVSGSTLHTKLGSISRSDWGMSTNLQSSFDAILNHAVANKVPKSDMPSKLFIISDMQFNVACSSNDKTNLEVAKAKYKKAGYKLPEIVFWNVNAIDKNSPVKMDDSGVALVSGCSPSILKTVLSGKIVSPYDVMLETINSARYSVISS